VAFYLGIDGGGSKTTCAVGDDLTTLATSTAGPSNVVRVGEAQARESLHLGIRQACAAAGITPAQISQTCIGAAGTARPEIAGTVRRALAEILAPPIEVVGDMQIALEAAFDAGPGVIVNAGTGSFAYGRDPQGSTARAGGWGFAISDEGSAHWIGRAAVTAVLRSIDSVHDARDGRSRDLAPPLLAHLLKAWNVASLEDFLRAANATPPPNFAALFPALLTAIQASDQLAQQVLTQAGQELARLSAIVIHRLQPAVPASPDASETRPPESPIVETPVRLAMAGGVFRHARLVREVFHNEIRVVHPHVEVNLQIVDPVEGALRLARSGPSGRAARTQAPY
jgi:glucosamine kinase